MAAASLSNAFRAANSFITALVAATFSQDPKDIPFALVYLTDGERRRARLSAVAGVAVESSAAPVEIDLASPTTREQPWPLAQAMNASSATVAAEVDEFELGGLTPAPSRLIAAPRVEESPVNFECRLTQLIQLETLSGVTVPTWLVLGEVVAVHIDRGLIKDGAYDTAAGQPILRAGKMGDYAAIRPDAMFEMPRPA